MYGLTLTQAFLIGYVAGVLSLAFVLVMERTFGNSDRGPP